MSHLPLNALRTFEAVASRLSFSEGAKALYVSPAAVSSQIRALEDGINQSLFHRHGRKVELTEIGEQLLPGVQRGMTELRKAMQSIELSRNEGVLNVSMVPIFLQKWMMPRLTGFYPIAPEVDLRVNADSRTVSFDETDFHAAVRFGPGHWPGLKASKLMDDWILPVCSPSLMENVGPIESVADLQKHNLLYAESEIWDEWFKDIKEIRNKADNSRGHRMPKLNDALSILLAAEQGAGIALSLWSLVARDIKCGRLIPAFPRLVQTDWSHYFVAPEHYFDMPKVAAFREWMTKICVEFEKP